MSSLAFFAQGASDADAQGIPVSRVNTTRRAARAMSQASTAQHLKNPPAPENAMTEERRSGEPGNANNLGFYSNPGKGQGGESVTGNTNTNSAGATPQEGMPKPGKTFSGNSH